MPVTTIYFSTFEHQENDVLSRVITQFEAMLSSSNCQIINIDTGNSKPKPLSFTGQIERQVTFIWTGNAPNIRSSYKVNIQRGPFNGVRAISFY